MVDISFVHKERQRIVAIDRLDEFMEIQHIDADRQLVLANKVFEFIGIELQVDQDNV
jgi:predicted deacetylase